ncbi:MAG: indole-3-glycerol-phosphate synthase TrpC, partial [Bacteroidaceae bacterium]
MKKDILTEIIANKRFEIDLQKQTISLDQLQENLVDSKHHRSMKQALASSSTGIISEFKRRSPSKGWIKKDAKPE